MLSQIGEKQWSYTWHIGNSHGSVIHVTNQPHSSQQKKNKVESQWISQPWKLFPALKLDDSPKIN